MVIIDAGHGGTDPGGGSNELFKEKDIALDISLYQYNRLLALGIDAKLVRDKDISLTPNERIEVIKGFNGTSNDILISNHINSSASNFKGAEIIYSVYKSDILPNLIANNIEAVGQNINRIFTRRNYKGDDYYFIIRNTKPIESILIEYGFGNNIEDRNFLQNNYIKLAEAVVKAIASYLGYKYYPPSDIVYKVNKGDSLYSIANKYNTSISEIKKLNNLTNDNLMINQILKIPYRKINNHLIPYKIKYGDTLYKISKMYNTTIDNIININNMDSPIIEIGSIIMIPKS